MKMSQLSWYWLMKQNLISVEYILCLRERVRLARSSAYKFQWSARNTVCWYHILATKGVGHETTRSSLTEIFDNFAQSSEWTFNDTYYLGNRSFQ